MTHTKHINSRLPPPRQSLYAKGAKLIEDYVENKNLIYSFKYFTYYNFITRRQRMIKCCGNYFYLHVLNYMKDIMVFYMKLGCNSI
jgi:hypothetical protein